MVVLVAELEDALEGPHGPRPVAHLEEGFPQPGQAVLVVGIQGQGKLEAAPGPGELLPGQVGVGHSNVQFDGVRVEGNAFLEDQQRFIVPAFVVELMGLFVEVVGAEKCIRHRPSSNG